MDTMKIDRERFGAFVAALRKEKGWTQQDLADKLFLSNKAVSKWERGISLPDTELLIPLAQSLGVSVTELLMGEKMQEDTMKTDEVEEIVQTAIAYSDEKPLRIYQLEKKWIALYGLCLAAALTGLFLNDRYGAVKWESLKVWTALNAFFGAYFCIFVKAKLPEYYDKYQISIYSDGPFRMNLAGLRINNRNWPHIVKWSRLWLCVSMAAVPFIAFIIGGLGGSRWSDTGDYIIHMVYLCGFFAAVYIAGKKRV